MISLFTGIGGFDLAAETLDWNILFQSEIDDYCIQVLNKRYPNIPKYGNINEIDATKFAGYVDVVAGGFPCQPFSNAGLQQGKEDPRFLWPQMYRVIQECRPNWVIAENVLGLISNANGLVFEQVCTDLEREGYKVQPFVIPAAGKDSFQERKRVWIVACLDGFGSEKNKVTSGEHFKAFRQTKKQLPGCAHFESLVSIRPILLRVGWSGLWDSQLDGQNSCPRKCHRPTNSVRDLINNRLFDE